MLSRGRMGPGPIRMERARARAAGFFQELSCHNLDIVFPKAVQAESLGSGVYLSIRSNLLVVMIGRPFRNVRVKTLAIFHHRRKQHESAPPPQLLLQRPTEFVP